MWISWEKAAVPVHFIIGLDGFPYAVLPCEYEAEDYADLLGPGHLIGCCGGLFNGVQLVKTIGM